jgi:hypothetical protein
MKLKNWIFFAGAVMIISSCGENSTSKETTTDSTASASMETPAPDNTAVAKPVEVPAATRTSFETKYPGATDVTWTYYDQPYTAIDWELAGWPTVDQNDYVVAYDWKGDEYYTWYDQDGNWIGTTTVITDYNNDLPSAVNNTLKNKFNGYTLVAADKENDKNREAYELDLEKGTDKLTVLVAADGTVIKKKGTVIGEKVKEKTDVK